MNPALKIIMDDREPKEIQEIMGQENIDIEIERLEIADYIISETLAVERKTGNDFVSAISDNRLFEQLNRLNETYTNPILILENFEPIFENRGMNINSIYGVLGYIASRMNISTVPTRNMNDTVILLKRLAVREQIKDENPILVRRAPKNMTLDDRCKYLVEGLFQTGPKTAEMLINELKTPLKVFNTIAKTEFTYTRTGKMKYIDGPLKDIKGIGIKFVLENKKLLLSKDDLED
ncbi:MAG: hypothetical protein GF329_03675 [Candidatus Lokiarchaeota archaeon]|nr:hypothetical protein [Candidatus Lokiarchaeota archaeon]